MQDPAEPVPEGVMFEETLNYPHLTKDGKEKELRAWAEARALRDSLPYTPEGGRGYADPEIYNLCDRLNALSGVCTLQSCAGHKMEEAGGYQLPGHLWLWLGFSMSRLFQNRVYELAEHYPLIEEIKVLHRNLPGEGPREIVDIVFQGQERGNLYQSAELIAAFFEELAREIEEEHVDLDQVEVIEHPSAEAAVRALLRRISEDSDHLPLSEISVGDDDENLDLDQVFMGGDVVDEPGESVEMTAAEFVRFLEEEGLWGFADTHQTKIHVWVAQGTPFSKVLNLLGHEVAHLLVHDEKTAVAELEEELWCCQIGDVIETAFRLAKPFRSITTEA